MVLPVNNRTASLCHLKFIIIINFYLLHIFTFSIQIVYSLISSDANDLQVLMRR